MNNYSFFDYEVREALHLSEVEKETSNSAQEHIHSFVINKAKSHLLNSSASVSEIAYSLGGDNPSYFGKLLKMKAGTTPAQYRKLTN